MSPLVIIGSGLAGYSLVREFRKLDPATPLLIVTRDAGGAYSKPMLSNALTKGKTAQDLVTADAMQMAQQLNAEIRTFAQVTKVDSDAHTLCVDNEELAYSKLVLAVGADPFSPPVTADDGSILTVNDLADYDTFRARIAGKTHIAILGGGLIGCEFANDLSNAGYQVSVIDRNPQPLAHLLPAELGEALGSALQTCGIEWYPRDTVTQIERNGGNFELHLDSGSRITADVVLSAIGLRSRTQLAKAAGLKINRGIVVDEYLQSSAADIYALGDCAEVYGAVLPFVMPLMIGARALAKTLAGTATAIAYPAMPVALKTPACPISVLPPPAGVEGSWQVEHSADGIKATYLDGAGQLRGFALSGALARQASALAKMVVLEPVPVLSAQL